MRFQIDDATAACWHFDEPKTAVLPNDATGHTTPLQRVIAGQVPAVVAGLAGPARRFQEGYAFQTGEAPEAPGALRLRRSMTLEAVLTYTPSSAPQVIACRGKRNDTGEERLWCVALAQIGGPVLRFDWDRASGAEASGASIPLGTLPAGFFYLAVVREWLSTTSCTVHAFVNGVLVGSATSSQADIENGDGGSTTIGVKWEEGDSAFNGFFAGTIDALRVSSIARSAEEIEHTHRALLVYPVWGYELLASLLPPGEAWTRSLDSRIQRFFMVAGGGLAIAWAKAAELLDFLPDRAWSVLDRWESITRLSPRPFDTIAQRRDRVVGFLRKVQGYSAPQIAAAVADLLGQAASNVVIREASNVHLLSFNGATIASKGLQEPNEGTIGQVNGLLTLSSQVGDDARWTAAVAKPVRLRASVAEGAEVEIIAGIKPALVDDGASCGVYVHNAATGAAQLFGILRSGGGNRWWYRTIDVDGESGAPTMGEVVGGLVPAGTVYWLRLKRRTDEEGEFDLQYRVDGSGFDGPWTTLASGLETIASPLHWCGPFVAVDTAPAVNGNAASFVDFRIVTPQSRHVWQWFVYRDPSLAPAYDRAGAQLVLDKMKPAHTRGTVIESLAFVVGSPFSRVGVEPVGVV